MNNYTIHVTSPSPLQTAAVPTESVQPMSLTENAVLNNKRCGCCRKKLTIVDFTCDKCQARFCSLHRLPEVHACSHNFRKETVKLEKVVADKMGSRI